MNKIVFVHDYPASQCALAKVIPDENGQRVARRFEVFVNGTELANGYWELTDADEQRRRFESDNQQRNAMKLKPVPMDERLLAAMEEGMADCAGVALGVDRLLMVMLGKNSLDEVMGFSAERC